MSVRLTIPSSVDPEQMAVHERLAEIGQILALGLVRLEARKSSLLSPADGDSFFDLLPDRSGHAATLTRGKA